MEAIVLAGGFGTRLQTVVSDVPKPMAPVADMPFLVHIFKYLKKNGIYKVILAVGYKAKAIEDYFGKEFLGIEIIYSPETEPLGTGGCIKKALQYVTDEQVYVINGDSYFDVDLKKMAKQGKNVMACKYSPMFSRYGKVDFNQDMIITGFNEKMPNQSGYFNGGIYLLQRDVFNKYKMPEKFSIENDFFAINLADLQMKAYLSKDYFIDIGIPEDYKKANEDFAHE